MGRETATAACRAVTASMRRLASRCGQGTVEYVALILLVALVMAGVVAAMKGYKTDGGKDLGDAIAPDWQARLDFGVEV